MSIVYDLLADVVKLMGLYKDGTATAASATTVTDATFNETADYWIGGTVLLETTNGSTACKQSARITDSTAAGVLTFGTLPAPVPTTGATFLAISKRCPRSRILQAINGALRECGNIQKISESLTIVAGQLDYTLPTDCQNRKIAQVWIEPTLSTEPYMPIDNDLWWADAGNKLRFVSVANYDSGATIRILYEAAATAIDSDDDTLPVTIPYDYLLHKATASCLQYLLMKERSARVQEQLNLELQLAEEALRRNPIRHASGQVRGGAYAR